MATSIPFRLSIYLTLAVACIALGHAIFPIFPEAGLFAAASVVALAVIYRLEVRVRLLSLADANMLGAGIAVCVALWAAYRIVQELRTGRSADLGWTLFLVSLMGPLLLAAIPAKLLRREKHAGDYWQLHVAALGAMMLAGAIDETPTTFALMAAYVGCAVWNLTQLHMARAEGSIPPVPLRAVPGEAAKSEPPVIRATAVPTHAPTGIVRALGMIAVAAAIATPLYFLMPRSPFGKQEFGKPRIEIGYAADQMIDLNRAGKLQTNHEVAFVVEARRQNRPVTDLNPNQYWRGRVLTLYRNGTWQKESSVVLPTPAVGATRLSRWAPPDLGPNQFELRFAVPVDLRTQFLAEPVLWKPGEGVPIGDILPGGTIQPWYVLPDGSFVRFHGTPVVDATDRYMQVYRPLDEPGLGPAFGRASGDVKDDLLECPITAVKRYSDDAVTRLVELGVLPAAVLRRDPQYLRIREEHHEAVARALEDYLSHRAGLVYTTELRRGDRDIDPIEDFLFHTKAGHCERFASALVLMLRAQGIPAAAVLGFKGCEHVGEGRYEVRQEHAHVWAEALISRPGDNGQTRWHWLSLDPSPDSTTESSDSRGAAALLKQVSTWGREKLERYFFHYSSEEQRRAIAAARRMLTSPQLLLAAAVLTALILTVLAFRRYSRHSQAAPVDEKTAWLSRLLDALAAAGFLTVPGQTPHEFALAVAAELQRRPPTAAVADVPPEWVETYYRLRFGGLPPSDEVQNRLDRRLTELKESLAQWRRERPAGSPSRGLSS